MPVWRGYWLHPKTGDVGARMPLASTGPWSVPLNAAGEWQPVVQRHGVVDPVTGRTIPGMLSVDREWWTPWGGGCLLTRELPGLEPEAPWLAGPITQSPRDDGKGTIGLRVEGIAAFLRKRVLTAGDYGPGAEDALKAATLSWSGLALGTLVWRYWLAATERRRAGGLPIVHGQPDEAVSPGHQRTMDGWNLANNLAEKRLGELSEVIDGPDWLLTPRWASIDRSRVEWVLTHGTDASPAIGQSAEWTFDTTAIRGGVVAAETVADNQLQANRVYATGAGEGAGIVVQIAQALDDLEAWEPLLERVVAVSDSEDPQVVLRHAEAQLEASVRPLVQVSITAEWARVVGFRVGWEATVVVSDNLYLSDGPHRMRAIALKGDLSGGCRVEFQPIAADKW